MLEKIKQKVSMSQPVIQFIQIFPNQSVTYDVALGESNTVLLTASNDGITRTFNVDAFDHNGMMVCMFPAVSGQGSFGKIREFDINFYGLCLVFYVDLSTQAVHLVHDSSTVTYGYEKENNLTEVARFPIIRVEDYLVFDSFFQRAYANDVLTGSSFLSFLFQQGAIEVFKPMCESLCAYTNTNTSKMEQANSSSLSSLSFHQDTYRFIILSNEQVPYTQVVLHSILTLLQQAALVVNVDETFEQEMLKTVGAHGIICFDSVDKSCFKDVTVPNIIVSSDIVTGPNQLINLLPGFYKQMVEYQESLPSKEPSSDGSSSGCCGGGACSSDVSSSDASSSGCCGGGCSSDVSSSGCCGGNTSDASSGSCCSSEQTPSCSPCFSSNSCGSSSSCGGGCQTIEPSVKAQNIAETGCCQRKTTGCCKQ